MRKMIIYVQKSNKSSQPNITHLRIVQSVAIIGNNKRNKGNMNVIQLLHEYLYVYILSNKVFLHISQ